MVRSTNHGVPHYVAVYVALQRPPCQKLSTPFSKTPVYILPLMRKTILRGKTVKKAIKLWQFLFNYQVMKLYRQWTDRSKVFNVKPRKKEVINFMFLLPCIVDIQGTEPTKCPMFFFRYLYYINTLSVSTRFNPQMVITREQVSNNIA
jgi:hypothetical protein